MITGIFAGITWALETVILGFALSLSPFVLNAAAIALAPFVSTFLHDAASAVIMWLTCAARGKGKELFSMFRSKELKWLVLASAIGGPCGMTGYVLAVNYMGASVGAIASAIYPAIGSVLAFLFLKEKVRWYQWIFLCLTIAGVFGISFSPDIDISNFWLGLLGAFMCAFGWGIEGVILSKCMKDDGIKSEYALTVRQSVSALIYGIIILPFLGGWDFTAKLFVGKNVKALLFVFVAALFATISYLLYYKTIAKLGVAKAMGLNITYTAWALVFSVAIFSDLSLLNPITVGCGMVVVVCGFLSATDIKELFNKKK